MGLLWLGRKAGTLVCCIGDVQSGALFKTVELPNDLPVMKTFMVWRCIFMVAKQHTGDCWHGFDLGIVGLEAKFF